MDIWRTIEGARQGRQEWSGHRVALVPTMGALHEGHQALIRLAKQQANRVIVSIFVNPTQFGPQEDLQAYPRPEADDLALCESLGVDGVFLPSVEAMYPVGDAPWMQVVPPANLTDILCGINRPGHFTGVATVVLKLFNILQPHLSVFGEKDAQQLAIIQRLVKDLNIPVEISPHPTLRETNGLALSSRNRYLKTEDEQKAARLLFQILSRIQEQHAQSEPGQPLANLLETSLHGVLSSETEAIRSLFQLEYLEARHGESLQPVTYWEPHTKVFIAAKVGAIRLIDNKTLV